MRNVRQALSSPIKLLKSKGAPIYADYLQYRTHTGGQQLETHSEDAMAHCLEWRCRSVKMLFCGSSSSQNALNGLT
ncbi:hypothetical protein BST61_g8805 [Cercospora zeina]